MKERSNYTTFKLILSRKRKYREDPNEMPNTILCYIFGSPKSGKTEILKGLVNKPFSDKYIPTETTHYAVNKVEREDDDPVYLVIKEFSYEEYPKIMKSEDAMDKCDIALLVFDGNDKYSFATLTTIQRSLYPHKIPCVYVLSKKDLEIVDQEHEILPQVFCTSLGLPWPPMFVSMKEDYKNRHQIYQTLVLIAEDP